MKERERELSRSDYWKISNWFRYARGGISEFVLYCQRESKSINHLKLLCEWSEIKSNKWVFVFVQLLCWKMEIANGRERVAREIIQVQKTKKMKYHSILYLSHIWRESAGQCSRREKYKSHSLHSWTSTTITTNFSLSCSLSRHGRAIACTDVFAIWWCSRLKKYSNRIQKNASYISLSLSFSLPALKWLLKKLYGERGTEERR